MKQCILLMLLASLVVACGATKKSKANQDLPTGTWSLSSITYDNSGQYTIKLFNDAMNNCLVGSTWRFSSNSNKGTYVINDTSCDSGKRYFDFTIDQTKQDTGLYDFLIKPTDANGNSATNAAFRTKMIYLTPSKMQWQQSTTVEGKPFVFKMNFVKN